MSFNGYYIGVTAEKYLGGNTVCIEKIVKTKKKSHHSETASNFFIFAKTSAEASARESLVFFHRNWFVMS